MWLSRVEDFNNVESIRVPGMDTIVAFDDDGHARTTKENGAVLIEMGIATERDTGHESSGEQEAAGDTTSTDEDSAGSEPAEAEAEAKSEEGTPTPTDTDSSSTDTEQPADTTERTFSTTADPNADTNTED